jgi:hypothetical protein
MMATYQGKPSCYRLVRLLAPVGANGDVVASLRSGYMQEQAGLECDVPATWVGVFTP